MPKIKITQTRSVIRYPKAQKDTIKSLGLGRPNNSVVKEDSPQIRGMIAKVRHLVTTEPAE